MEQIIHPVDRHVGAMLRARRKEMRLSQQQLGDKMDQLTFQQVQKYERGANRVSASKLWEAAKALQVPVAYFFAGLEGKSVDAEAVKRHQASMSAVELVPSVARLGELERHQHQAIDAIILAMLASGSSRAAAAA